MKSLPAAIAIAIALLLVVSAWAFGSTASQPSRPASIGHAAVYAPTMPTMRIGGGGVSISRAWQPYPTHGRTHFAQVWTPFCGRPVSRERRRGMTWTQRFQHCIMRDTVSVISDRPVQPTPYIPPTAHPIAQSTVTPVQPTDIPVQPTNPPTSAPPSTPCAPDCSQWVLGQINAERTQYGEAPLTLSPLLSNGDESCIGAIGHADHMANDLHTIAHDQFPADVCGSYSTAGENVGVSAYGSLAADVQQIHISMKSEPFSLGCSGNHHCDWMNPSFTRIGIGIVAGAYAGLPAHYLSEEFAG